MRTKYYVSNDGIITEYATDFDFVSKVVNLLVDGFNDFDDFHYSLTGHEIEDDPNYDYQMTFSISGWVTRE